jgi:putative redox protein
MMTTMKTVTVDWQPEQDRFEAHGGHAGRLVHMNAPHAEGGPTGFSASEMLLAGAGGCSAWDVVEILRKQRQRVSAIHVVVSGEQATKPPFPFVRVHVQYTVSGQQLDEAKVRRAVELSERRYCSVIGTIRGVAEVSCDVHVLEAEAPGPGAGAADRPMDDEATGALPVEATVVLRATD